MAVFLTLTLLVGRSQYAGGPVDGGDSLRRSAGNLVDSSAMSAHDEDSVLCIPAGGTYGGTSKTTWWGNDAPFETCYEHGFAPKYVDVPHEDQYYCWTKSYHPPGDDNKHDFYQCIPDGPYSPSDWHAYDGFPRATCGKPCQDQHADCHSLRAGGGFVDCEPHRDDDVPPEPDHTPCLQAGGSFKGVSTTTGLGKTYAFETCYQNGNEAKYCWSKSHLRTYTIYHECVPLGGDWHSVDPKYVNPVTHPYSCGEPCSVFDCYECNA